jgi:hypothetical protein
MILREEGEEQRRGEGITVRSGEGARGGGLFRPGNVREEVGSSLERGAARTEQAAEPASP